MVSLPVQEQLSAPVQEIASAPVQEQASTPWHKLKSAPKQELASLPVQDLTSAPVRELASAPVQELASAPVQVLASAPVQELASAPVRELASAPVLELASAPVLELASAPVLELAVASVPVLASAPVQMASASVQELSSAPEPELESAPAQILSSAQMASASVQMTSASVQMTSASVQKWVSVSQDGMASAPKQVDASAPLQDCASAHLIGESVVQCVVEPLKLTMAETTSDGTMLLQIPTEAENQAAYLQVSEVNPALGLSYDVLILEPSESSIADMFMDSVAEQAGIQDSSRIETSALEQVLETDVKAIIANMHVDNYNSKNAVGAVENSNSSRKNNGHLVEVEQSCLEVDIEPEKMEDSCSENNEMLKDDNSGHNTADQVLMEKIFHNPTLVEDDDNNNSNKDFEASASAAPVEKEPDLESCLVKTFHLSESGHVQDVKLLLKCGQVQLEKLDPKTSHGHLKKLPLLKKCHVLLERLDDVLEMGSGTRIEEPFSLVVEKSTENKLSLKSNTKSSMVIETQGSISSLPSKKISFKINKKTSKLTTQYQRSVRTSSSGKGCILRDASLGSSTVEGSLEKKGNGRTHVQRKEAAGSMHQSTSKSKHETPKILNDGNQSSGSSGSTKAVQNEKKVARQVRTGNIKDVKPVVVVRTCTLKEVKNASEVSNSPVKDVQSALQVSTGSVKDHKQITALQIIPNLSLSTNMSFKIPKKKTIINQSSSITLNKVMEASSEGEIMKLARGIIGTKVDVTPCAAPELRAGNPPHRKVEAPCTALGLREGSPHRREVEVPLCAALRSRESSPSCKKVEASSCTAPELRESSPPQRKVAAPLFAAPGPCEVSLSLQEYAPPHSKVGALQSAEPSIRNSSSPRRKAYMEPFISKDPLENRDNADPRWEVFRHQKSDEERYQKVRELWQNEVVPDPNLNMTNHARKRFIRECRLVAGEGPVTSTVRLATVAAAAQRVLSAGRKRARQEDDTDQLPPSKRARTTGQLTDITFGLRHSAACDERVRRNYEDLCCSSGRSFTARQMKRITEDYYKKRDLIAVGQDEAEKLHQFYSGLADQGRGLNSYQTQRELQEMERLYFAFRRHYNWAGNEFVTIHD